MIPAATSPAVAPSVAPVAARLVTLALRDFRNIAEAELPCATDGLVILGENGHGKSNLVEAIAYLRLLRSQRGARDRDLIRFGAPAFHVAATLAGVAPHRASAAVDRQGRKKVTLDGAEPERLTDALDALPSVSFSPRDVDLVAGAPAERRRYLDITLALTSPRYLQALRHYRAALARRLERGRALAPLGLGLVVLVGEGLQPLAQLALQRRVVDLLLGIHAPAGLVVGERHLLGPGAQRILVVAAPDHEPHRRAAGEVEKVALALVGKQLHRQPWMQRALQLAVVAQHARRGAKGVFHGQHLDDAMAHRLPAVGLQLALHHDGDADGGTWRAHGLARFRWSWRP